MSTINPQSLARLSMTVNVAAKTLDIGVKQPFRISLPDPANPGSYIEKKITAPAQIKGNGHASENFKLGPAGQTLAVAWANDFGLYWYLTYYGGSDYFVASRNPCMTNMPASANNIGDFDAAPATSNQANVFIAASITKADFIGLPVWPMGSMPVQRSANQNELDLVALTAGQDGMGLYQVGVPYIFPEGQNGATAGSYFSENGSATALDFATMTYTYWMNRNGICDVYFNTGARSAADASALNLRIHLPAESLFASRVGSGICRINTTLTTRWIFTTTGVAYFSLNASDASTTTVANFADAGDYIDRLSFSYRAFRNRITS